MHKDISDKSKFIKQTAFELGFAMVGFAKSEHLEKEGEKLKQWLAMGYHGEMSYLENHFDKRTDPALLVPGAKSIICLAYNYHTEESLHPESYKISSYAYGRDYHKVIKKKLKRLSQLMTEKFGSFQHRFFVDSAPVLERDWALRSGLGWIGKNTLLIHPKKGSKFFLAEMIIDFELVYDDAIHDHCGTCTRCIDACPTDAIHEEGYLLDASKCISYLTIELKSPSIPDEFKGQMEDWIYGCDICQDVCPWNRFSTPHEETTFLPSEKLRAMKNEDWKNMSSEEFNELFEGSAVKRAGYDGLKRNIDFLNP